MLRSKRFEPIQAIVAAAAQQLSLTMGEAGRRVADLERQLAQLNGFRDEYASKSSGGQGTMDVVKLQNNRAFLDRLGDVLRQHAIKLEAARSEYERRRVVWSDKRIEAESLGRAIERFRREEHYEADQREQREGDENATRISIERATRDTD